MFTRQGHSPNVKFPRILGIEATGLVEEAPGGEFESGDIVATAMGEMGRAFDGGYVSVQRPVEILSAPSAHAAIGGVYLRTSKTGAEAEDKIAMGNPRRLWRDAPNGVWFVVQSSAAEER